MDGKFSKLPLLAKPTTYDLHLKPCLKTFKCPGTTSIAVEVIEKTKFFTLHAKDLEIKTVSVELSDGKILENLPVELDKKWDLVTVNFPVELEAKSNVKLNFDYCAELNNIMQGFSRSVYKDKDNKDKYMASTQFESTYAREAFPCWDEPIYKAVFNVALEVDDSLTALSNMNVVDERKVENGKKLLKFAPTPLMSSYLVAFAVGEFEYIETKTNNGIVVRVYTVEGKKQYGEYSLNFAAKSLDFFDDWFGIKCPLPKCDLIAIPEFSMGAMENWGLITYREVSLLVDPIKTSTIAKSGVAHCVAHEVGHFWFGNLVTMKWWTDLWLKEGFASFMEYYLTSHLCPEFKVFLHYVNTEVASGFSLDSLRNSHPIEVEIENPNQLDEIYDCVTYCKSNSIIRMLFEYLGEPTFQKGLRLYLQKFKYSNAETVDLWNALSEASGKDVNTMMSSWTKQMGYPIVSVQQKIDSEKRVLKLHQERFLADGGRDELNSQWHIPITVISASSPEKPIYQSVLKSVDGEITLEGVKPDEWVKLNTNLTGFYRVQYTGDMLEAILPAVESKQLSIIDRFSIASDLLALVKAGRSPMSQFLKFFAASQDEDEYIVWCAISNGLATVSNIIEFMDNGKELLSQFDKFVCKILEPLSQRLGWEPTENEDSHKSLLRALVLARLARSNHEPTIQTALKKFDEHVEKKTELVADLRSMIYSVAGRNNQPKATGPLKNIFETVRFSEVECQCVSALGKSTNKDILDDVYKYCIDDGKLRPQDFTSLFYGTVPSRVGKEYIWNYVKQNLKKLLSFYGSVNHSIFQDLVSVSIRGNCSSSFADEALQFFKTEFDEHSLKVLDRCLNQSLECVRLNEKILKENASDIEKFFAGGHA